MNEQLEFYIDHEARIRLLEEIAKDIRDSMRHMDGKMDSLFKWVIGTVGFGILGLIAAKLI